MTKLPIYKFLIFNVAIVAVLSYLNYGTGLIQRQVFSDTTHTAVGIATVFVVLTAFLFVQGIRMIHSFNSRHIAPGYAIGAFWCIKLEVFNKSASWFFILGMIGTILGMGITLEGVSPTAFGTLEGFKGVAVSLLKGLRTELPATFVGAVTGLWMEVNFHIFKTPAELRRIR